MDFRIVENLCFIHAQFLFSPSMYVSIPAQSIYNHFTIPFEMKD